MKYELYCQNSVTGTLYDITDLAGTITHTTHIDGQPGKLTFDLLNDPEGVLEIACGSIVTFSADDTDLFYGYVFTIDGDELGNFKITAYDQLRYLKNQEVYTTNGMTASEIFDRVCKDNLPNSRYEVVTPSTFVVADYYHVGRTLYQIIEYGIAETRDNVPDKLYLVRDSFGVMQFTERDMLRTNVILGEKSLLSHYNRTVSIDDDTYNYVKIYRDDKNVGNRGVWLESDPMTEKYWGKLQLFERAPKDSNEAQIRELAQSLLKKHNRESQTARLDAVGHVELQAGSGFLLQIDALGLDQEMYVESAIHTYGTDHHTMSLEVEAL